MTGGEPQHQRIPWQELLCRASRELGWTPDTFWQATPNELKMALAPVRAPNTAALSKKSLDQLLLQFPDK